MNTRIVLVDDHRPFRTCLRGLLDRQPGCEVVGDFDSGAAVLEALSRTTGRRPPDVLLLDLDLGGSSGLDIARHLLAAHPALPILVLSWHDELPLVSASQAAGCAGFMRKDDALPELVEAIHAVAAGRTHLSRALRPALGVSASQSPQFSD